MLRVSNQIQPFEFNNFSIHFARYKLAARLLRHNAITILDLGCGTGYGSAFLSEQGFNVTAVDLNQDVLANSWGGLRDVKNLVFKDFNEVRKNSSKFDALISFEVIEHVANENLESYFSYIKNKLKEERGMHISSTPRYLPMNERSDNRKREHIKEYTYDEYVKTLKNHFSLVSVLSQNDTTIGDQSEKMAWNYFAICYGVKNV